MISVCEMRNDFELLETYLDRYSDKVINFKYFIRIQIYMNIALNV